MLAFMAYDSMQLLHALVHPPCYFNMTLHTFMMRAAFYQPVFIVTGISSICTRTSAGVRLHQGEVVDLVRLSLQAGKQELQARRQVWCRRLEAQPQGH